MGSAASIHTVWGYRVWHTLFDSRPHPTPIPILYFGGASVERMFCRVHPRKLRLGFIADGRQTERSSHR